MQKLAYVKVEVGGIQNFIASTGKLKEMIGGSEIIYHVCKKDFFENILEAAGCARAVNSPAEGGWHILIQNNAGVLALVLPGKEKAREFLKLYSGQILEQFPGLPIFGACAEMDFEQDAYRKARSEADRAIGMQRASCPTADGLPMLPILRAARLDGLPAVAKDPADKDLISLPSLTRRNEKMISDSEERLRSHVQKPEGITVNWPRDLNEMLAGGKAAPARGGKIALIHMDGNDLGKLFTARLGVFSQKKLEEGIASMRELSELIRQAGEAAFSHAAEGILQYWLAAHPDASEIVMPLRPLVLGGDDITLIARADVALPFISMFTRKFEEMGKSENLSLGIGMLVMDSSYPFARAFRIVESLLESAKHATLASSPRPSSIDYLIITDEVETNVAALRERVFTTPGGARLTDKPFVLQKTEGGDALLDFLRDGVKVLDRLPRSAMRQALSECRKGPEAAHRWWVNARDNLERGLGGRMGKERMDRASFEKLFPDGFFHNNKTRLGDYLELERLLPADHDRRKNLLQLMANGGGADA